MDVVYYGNYPQYFEVGRVESLRALGISYKDIEEMGIILPVVDLHIKYLRPAKYDDLLTIKTIIKELPVDHKITFHQEVYNEAGKLLTVGTVKLYFMDQTLQNKASMPLIMLEKLKTYFS
jgi:acyl-CoA thioester hydrolase